MRTESIRNRLRRILRQCRKKGYFRKLNGEEVALPEWLRSTGQRWTEKELPPDRVSLTTIFADNGAT
jgi:hypothetical protein